MDKNEFIDAVAKQKGISRGKAYRSVEAVMGKKTPFFK